jgi:hypothetical protein
VIPSGSAWFERQYLTTVLYRSIIRGIKPFIPEGDQNTVYLMVFNPSTRLNTLCKRVQSCSGAGPAVLVDIPYSLPNPADGT